MLRVWRCVATKDSVLAALGSWRYQNRKKHVAALWIAGSDLPKSTGSFGYECCTYGRLPSGGWPTVHFYCLWIPDIWLCRKTLWIDHQSVFVIALSARSLQLTIIGICLYQCPGHAEAMFLLRFAPVKGERDFQERRIDFMMLHQLAKHLLRHL